MVKSTRAIPQRPSLQHQIFSGTAPISWPVDSSQMAMCKPACSSSYSPSKTCFCTESLWRLTHPLISERENVRSKEAVFHQYSGTLSERTRDKHNIPEFTAPLSCLPPSYKPLQSVTTMTEQDRSRENSSTQLSGSFNSMKLWEVW